MAIFEPGIVAETPRHSGEYDGYGGDICVTIDGLVINLGQRGWPDGQERLRILAYMLASAPRMLDALRQVDRAIQSDEVDLDVLRDTIRGAIREVI